MESLQEPQITTQAILKPIYVEEQGQFKFEMTVTNQHSHRLHFYIASTFGHCLTETTLVRTVEPNSSVLLVFCLRPTNLIAAGAEVLAIYFHQEPLFQQFPSDFCQVRLTRLLFSQENQVDPAITEILESEAEFCLAMALSFQNEGTLSQALSKCEEAYETMRTSHRVIESLVSIRIQLMDFQGAVLVIQAAMLFGLNLLHFQLQKALVVSQWFRSAVSSTPAVYQYLKSTVDFLLERKYQLTPEDQQLLEKLSGDLEKERKVVKEPNKMLLDLIEKAVALWSPQAEIAYFYTSKEDLRHSLQQIILAETSTAKATPEEVLDPITYEIMGKPMILPSGNSFEEGSLRAYFASQGFRDPISRQGVGAEQVWPNRGLQELIALHPRLCEWQQYEHDFIYN